MAGKPTFSRATPLYCHKVWGKDIIPFLHHTAAPVWRTKIEKVKWFYTYSGCYTNPTDKRIKLDHRKLKRLGFQKVELVKLTPEGQKFYNSLKAE